MAAFKDREVLSESAATASIRCGVISTPAVTALVETKSLRANRVSLLDRLNALIIKPRNSIEQEAIAASR
jgi:hypothetical protein